MFTLYKRRIWLYAINWWFSIISLLRCINLAHKTFFKVYANFEQDGVTYLVHHFSIFIKLNSFFILILSSKFYSNPQNVTFAWKILGLWLSFTVKLCNFKPLFLNFDERSFVKNFQWFKEIFFAYLVRINKIKKSNKRENFKGVILVDFWRFFQSSPIFYPISKTWRASCKNGVLLTIIIIAPVWS